MRDGGRGKKYTGVGIKKVGSQGRDCGAWGGGTLTRVVTSADQQKLNANTRQKIEKTKDRMNAIAKILRAARMAKLVRQIESDDTTEEAGLVEPEKATMRDEDDGEDIYLATGFSFV